jgi:hypothetical protein
MLPVTVARIDDLVDAAPDIELVLPLNMHLSQLVSLNKDDMLEQCVRLLKNYKSKGLHPYYDVVQGGAVKLHTTFTKWEYLTEHRVNNATIRCLWLMMSYYKSDAYKPEKAEGFYMEQVSYLTHLLLTWRLLNEPG